MKRLVILVNAFPYGNWEPFLSTELEYLTCFNRIDVMSLSVRPEQRASKRPLPGNARAYPIAYRSRAFYVLASLRVLLDANLYRELAHLARTRCLSPSRLVTLFVFLSRAHHEAAMCRRILSRQAGADPHDSVVFYSYRLAYQPYMARLLRRYYPRSVSVARAHRADLYEEFSPRGYLPLREHTMRHLDRIYCIAEHGRAYLDGRSAAARTKTVVSRLGTTDRGVPRGWPSRRQGLRLVTCSTIVPVKRLHLLIDALAGATFDIQWDHFGEGPLHDELARRARLVLDDRVSLTFRGFVSNADLVTEYVSSPRHLLVNVSASEGVPVSIMEALSTGTPVVATDVGGTSELVRTGVNGVLLPADPSPEQVLRAVELVAHAPEEEYAAMRRRARQTWEEHCDARRLYAAFASELIGLGTEPPEGRT